MATERERQSAATYPDDAGRRAFTVGSERGVALIVVLMSLMLMTALGVALLLTTSGETMIAGNFKDGQEALYAADAGVERAMEDLLTVPDWNKVLRGQTTSAFIDGAASGERTIPGGGKIDLSEVLNMADCGHTSGCSSDEMNAITTERPWATNNPRWQLYAYGRVSDLVPTGTIDSPYYVVVMVGDDPSENDGDPTTDGTASTNPGRGVLSLRAEAFGPRGAHKAIEVTLARTDASELERGYAGQRGQDEQNRRARKAAVQTPGKSLTRSVLSLSGPGGYVKQ